VKCLNKIKHNSPEPNVLTHRVS